MTIAKTFTITTEEVTINAELGIDGALDEIDAAKAVSVGVGKLAHAAGRALEALQDAVAKPHTGETGSCSFETTKSHSNVTVTLKITTMVAGVKPFIVDIAFEDVLLAVVKTTLHSALGITDRTLAREFAHIERGRSRPPRGGCE